MRPFEILPFDLIQISKVNGGSVHVNHVGSILWEPQIAQTPKLVIVKVYDRFNLSGK